MVRLGACVASLLLLSTAAFGSGPADRVATNPKGVASATHAATAPLQVMDVLETVRLAGATWSPDGKQIGYISNASGRFNLWVMNADGSAARQLLKSDDRQAEPLFTKDGADLIYTQDHGGDELYDVYVVPVAGGPPKNLTHTDQVTETNPQVSPDGKWLSFSSKEKTAPSTNLAVIEWATGTSRLLTHEADPKASWSAAAWSPDGKWIYANRSVGLEDSDIYRIDARTAAAEKLTSHSAKELVAVSDISPDGKTLLITSNAKGGFGNVALLDVATNSGAGSPIRNGKPPPASSPIPATRSPTYSMPMAARRSSL